MRMDFNEKFKTLSRVVLGGEVGELGEFDGFLKQYRHPLYLMRSSASGKETYCHAPYCKKARFISLGESGWEGGSAPLDINDIKDIDSLLGAAGEVFAYCGNKILGKSEGVSESDDCRDAINVFRSMQVYNSRDIAYCEKVLNSRMLFGCSAAGPCSFCLNCSEMYKCSRGFGSGMVMECTDIWMSYNCKNCTDVMFSFNQRSARNCIGNNCLPRDMYAKLKEKLFGEMREFMMDKKTFPTLAEISLNGWKHGQ